MATSTIYTTACVWGSSSFNSTTDLKVGKSSSTTYKGRITFAAVPANWVITKITLKLNRIDTNAAHTLTFGGSSGSGFSATLDFSISKSISTGKGSKEVDLTAYARTIQGYGGTWYIHVRHGSGSNSYTEFSGDERSTSLKPQLVIEYEQATVYVNVSGTWKQCLVYYRNGTQWVQCVPYYRNGSTWVQV